MTATATVTLPQAAVQHLIKVTAKGKDQRATIVSHPKGNAASVKAGHKLTKIINAVIVTGEDYVERVAKAEADLATQDPTADPKALPWGQWQVFPYLIEHKGEWYARLYLADDEPMLVTYQVDGVEVSKDVFNAHLTPSAANRKAPKVGTITPKLSGVTLA